MREKTFPNTYLLAGFLGTYLLISLKLLTLQRGTYCQDKIAKLKDLVMEPNDFYQQDQQRSLQSPPQIFTQLFNAYYKVHFLIYFLQQLRILERQSFHIDIQLLIYKIVYNKRKYLFQLTLNAIFSFYFLSDLNKPMTQYPNEGKKGNK